MSEVYVVKYLDHNMKTKEVKVIAKDAIEAERMVEYQLRLGSAIPGAKKYKPVDTTDET